MRFVGTCFEESLSSRAQQRATKCAVACAALDFSDKLDVFSVIQTGFPFTGGPVFLWVEFRLWLRSLEFHRVEMHPCLRLRNEPELNGRRRAL